MADTHYNTDKIYQTLRQEIMLLTLEPGTLVSEGDISQRFSVSRTPVREVFKRLELEGLLEVRPQRGTFVSRLRLGSLYDLVFSSCVSKSWNRNSCLRPHCPVKNLSGLFFVWTIYFTKRCTL